MRTSNLYFPTLKEDPSDAELISHKLMLRAGLIRKLSSGIYTWLPLGLKVLRKIESIIHTEMAKINSQEILMPAICPAELWQESGRWEQYGPLLLRIKDRHQREFCFGPTHEEVVTDLIRHEIKSYKQLPLTLYQIQTKFRDEIRPRFGVMRGREFLMKDAYSFNLDQDSLDNSYQDMYQAYCNIFDSLGLDYRPVEADNGDIGGSMSHEFQVIADSGEDLIACSDTSDYAANIEQAETKPNNPNQPILFVNNPKAPVLQDLSNITETKLQAEKLNLPLNKLLKTLIIKADQKSKYKYIALVVCGNHEINPFKATKLPIVNSPLELITDIEVKQIIGCEPGFIGPLDLDKFNIPVIIDYAAAQLTDFACGSNQNNKLYSGANWEQNNNYQAADIRFIQAGDTSPDDQGNIILKRGIEVGQVFKLGDKYSKSMDATVLDQNGKAKTILMGCYGIGVSRTLAACIEQTHDENGIIWNKSLQPFDLSIIPIAAHKNPEVKQLADNLYKYLKSKNYDVLLEDRNERPGVMFADHDLIGIPFRIVISAKNLAQNQLEFKARTAEKSEDLPFKDIEDFGTILLSKINKYT